VIDSDLGPELSISRPNQLNLISPPNLERFRPQGNERPATDPDNCLQAGVVISSDLCCFLIAPLLPGHDSTVSRYSITADVDRTEL